jgi:hypothetical protein
MRSLRTSMARSGFGGCLSRSRERGIVTMLMGRTLAPRRRLPRAAEGGEVRRMT